MHITVEIEGSSERDVATSARGAAGMGSEIVIGHCLDPVLPHDIRRGGRCRRWPYRRCRKYEHSGKSRRDGNGWIPGHGRVHEETTLECASIDMSVLKVRPDISRICGLYCNIRSSDAPCRVKFLRWLIRG